MTQACSSNIPSWHSDANFPPQAWHNALHVKIISHSMPIFGNPQPVPNECWKSALELPLQVVRHRRAPPCSHFVCQCHLVQQAPLAALVLFKVRLAREGGRAGIAGPNHHDCQAMLQQQIPTICITNMMTAKEVHVVSKAQWLQAEYKQICARSSNIQTHVFIANN